MMKSSNGAVVCARYAFAPNYYHYCGPDTSGAFGEYVACGAADGKLTEYITQFETLYPYLKAIASANGIAEPLDERVVEAYWVGNALLDKVSPQYTFITLTESQQLKKRLDTKSLLWLLPKIDQFAKLHHSFHVFNIFTRTGYKTVAHTVETMDQCRIGWGQIQKSVRQPADQSQISGPIQIESQRLVYTEGKLQFEPATREVINPIEDLHLKPGDWVTFHWGYVCDVVSKPKIDRLARLTRHHLQLANQTL